MRPAAPFARAGAFALSRSPVRLDLHNSLAAGCVVAKTVPFPVFGAQAQTGPDRIPMNIAELFHKLWVVSSVEIVIALSPEVFPTQATVGLSGPPFSNRRRETPCLSDLSATARVWHSGSLSSR